MARRKDMNPLYVTGACSMVQQKMKIHDILRHEKKKTAEYSKPISQYRAERKAEAERRAQRDRERCQGQFGNNRSLAKVKADAGDSYGFYPG